MFPIHTRASTAQAGGAEQASLARVQMPVPDAEWRTPVRLCRFAGLRCLSEDALIRCEDVKRKDGRLRVRSPKTAGHKSWPRLFHNLRASCATDWVVQYPGCDVAAWLGHSPTIAAKHYWQPRDVYMDLAAGRPARDAKTGADSDARPAQSPEQPPPASDRKGSGEESKQPSFSGVSRADASLCESATEDGNGRNRTRTCDLGYVTAAL